MLFGSIDYLNLLPFQVFLKKNLTHRAVNLSRYKNVPSQINSAFHKGKVNAAFISSVTSKGCKCTDVGIIGKGKVYSVLLIKGDIKEDSASQTSNALAKLLGLKGEVMIGDKALRYYLSGNEALDLSLEWQNETNLPFVFARLCYNKHGKMVKKLAKIFSHTKVPIPQYILKKEALKRGITPRDARWYLEHIHYRMDYKAKKSLKMFLRSTAL